LSSVIARRSIGELVKPVRRIDPSKDLIGRFRYVDLSAIDPGDRVLSRRTLLGVTEAPSRARQLLESDDVLFATVRPYQGKVAIVAAEDDGAVASTGFTVLRANNEIHPHYLLHALTSDDFLSQILPLQRGTSYPAVSDKDVFTCEIPVPPLEQQHEIVERIESALTKLDAALRKLNLAESKRESARIAILHKHFAPSRSRVARIQLSDVLEAQIGGAWGDLPGSGEFEVKVLRATEMDKLGRLNLSSAVDRSVTMSQYVSRELLPGDLVMEKSGGGPNQPVGRVGLYNGPTGGYITSNFMLKMRPNSAVVDPNYLWLQLMYTHLSGGTIALQSSSTNIRNVTVSEYLNLELFVPPMEKQRTISLELTESMRAIDATAQQLATIKKFIETERRAILQTAFSAEREDK
jgi:type I restriction enzyme S subunit